MSRTHAGGQFIRSGFALLFLGFVMSVGMVMHYVVGGQYPTGHDFRSNVTLWWACPWTLSTAVVLGGSLCLIVIGTVHTSLGRFSVPDVGLATRIAHWLCVLALVAIFLTGYIGYFVVDAIWPMFYYMPVAEGKNAWLLMQLACIVVFALGVGVGSLDIWRASRGAISAATM